jgi:hypothetical protein
VMTLIIRDVLHSHARPLHHVPGRIKAENSENSVRKVFLVPIRYNYYSIEIEEVIHLFPFCKGPI